MALHPVPPAPTTPAFPGLAEKAADTYNQSAEDWANAQPGFAAGVKDLGENTYANAVEAGAQASLAVSAAEAAAQSKADAAVSLAAAQAVSGATKWAAGSYVEGVVTWSPANGQNYRRRSPGGASVTDPSLDPAGWFALLLMQALPMVRISGNATASLSVHYLMDPPAAPGVPYTLKFPPGPVEGDVAAFSHFTGLRTCVLDPNGALLMGRSGTCQLDDPTAGGLFKYSNTYGWVKQ